MLQDIEMTPEIKDWEASASLVTDVSDKFDDILIGNIGNIHENQILDFPEDDILINYQNRIRGNRKYPLLEQVDNGILRDKFGNWSLYDSAGNDISGESSSDILLGESGNNTIDSNYDRNYNDEEKNYLFESITGDRDTERAIAKKVLLDADIIFDVLLDRECPTLEDSVAAIDLVSSKLVKGYIASSDFEQIVSLVQLRQNPENANRIKQKLLNFLEVCEVDGKLLGEASQMSLPNFKNTIQLACAVRYKLDAIVTLNSQDFWGDENSHPNINVFTPSEFLNNYYGLDLCDAINGEYVEFREKLEKDLEANCMLNEDILDEKLSLGTGWVVDNWIVRCAQNNFTEATVILRNPETSEQHTEFVIAKGPIEASCKALDRLVKQLYELPEYSFKDFLTRNVSDEGAAATVEATVIVKCDDLTYTSDYTHRSITQAVFYAYVKSVDKILRRETPEKADKAVNNFVNKLKLAKGLP
jgi:LeuA allosteric (dimerisation) domain